jgi:hypothetical protein
MGSINSRTLSTVVNIPSMGPALAINYAALMNGAPSIVLAEHEARN